MYTCPVTGWLVMPANVFDCGHGIVSFQCPSCDSSGNGRNDPGYQPAQPGLHYEALTPIVIPRVYPWKKLKRRAA